MPRSGLGESRAFPSSNSLLAAVTDGNVIVGSWQVDDCGCRAELTFEALTYEPLAFEVNAFGIVEQGVTLEVVPEHHDLTEVWCSTTLWKLDTQFVQ